MEIKEVLYKTQFRFKKNLGQNFITDSNLLDAIVADAGVEEGDTVVEIGTGAGTLTAALAKKAKRVITFDVDEDLKEVLKETLPQENVEIHFMDVLKMSDGKLKELIQEPFKLVANLPYYVTTPMLMRFLESDLPVRSLTLMVQKEVADRLTAKPNTEEYGAITLQVKLRGDARLTRTVSKRLFYPVPKVDSAVVRIDVSPKYDMERTKAISRAVKAGFQMRRKTLVNNLVQSYGLSRENAVSVVEKAGLPTDVRGERLSLEDYCRLTETLESLV